MQFEIPWELIVRAIDRIGKCSNRDSSGVCVLIIRAFIFGNSTAAQRLFTHMFTSSDFMKSFTIDGSLFGKESSCTTSQKTRAVLPLPALLACADSILACVIHDIVDEACRPSRGIMFGAKKGTQVLDIAHAAHLHLQKGADNFNKAGLAQGDIGTYYDSISGMKIARWILDHSTDDPLFWSSAFLRLQLLPSVRLTAGGSCTFTLNCRTVGTLTGSRSAVAAGRIPTESVACDLCDTWKPLGVQIDGAAVTFACWVDNYYTFGSSISNAIEIAETFEKKLLAEWDLHIKPSSRSVIGPDPSDEDYANSEKWPMQETVDILGHLITANCSPWPCFRRTEKQMWAAYWANCVGKQACGLSVKQRCRMLDRCVQPLLNFRNTRWPWTAAIADAQNKLQRRMLIQFLSVERWPCESLEDYFRRRMRAAADLARQQGDWGTQHAKRVCCWAEHLERPRNRDSVASMLFQWHNAAWLEERRLDSSVGGSLRPGTRSQSGFLNTRWDESVSKAQTMLKK